MVSLGHVDPYSLLFLQHRLHCDGAVAFCRSSHTSAGAATAVSFLQEHFSSLEQLSLLPEQLLFCKSICPFLVGTAPFSWGRRTHVVATVRAGASGALAQLYRNFPWLFLGGPFRESGALSCPALFSTLLAAASSL